MMMMGVRKGLGLRLFGMMIEIWLFDHVAGLSEVLTVGVSEGEGVSSCPHELRLRFPSLPLFFFFFDPK